MGPAQDRYESRSGAQLPRDSSIYFGTVLDCTVPKVLRTDTAGILNGEEGGHERGEGVM